MSGGFLSTQNFSVTFDKVNWPTLVNGLSYITKDNSILFPATEANIKSEKVGELPGICYSWELSQARTSLVVREHNAIQWQKNSTAGTSDDHPNRCFHKQKGGMVKKRTGTLHKCFRTSGCEIFNPDFTKNFSNLTIHIQMDNKVALSYLLKMGLHTV